MFKIKLLSVWSKAPVKEKENDAGFDVFNAGLGYTLGPGERCKFPLGFAMELPPGWVGIIHEKSGLANNQGIMTIGNVIDAGYRGECHAILVNTSTIFVYVDHCQKIAQLLIIPCYTGKTYEIVTELSESDRGSGGFGSTGLGLPKENSGLANKTGFFNL